MSLPRLDHATHIADRLNELAAIVKTRTRANLNDDSQILETIAKRFFNTLRGWDLVNLNAKLANYPAADLGDRKRRIAIQVTNQEGSDKISHTAAKASEHNLGKDFHRLTVFFLLPKKPAFPKKFVRPPGCPEIETWDIKDLLEELKETDDLEVLAAAAKVLDEEMGRIRAFEAVPKRRYVTNLEVVLDRPASRFDRNEFMSALKQLLEAKVESISITSIKEGSTIVPLDGDGEVLGRLVDKLTQPSAETREFIRQTGYKMLNWRESGKNRSYTVTERSEDTRRMPADVRVDISRVFKYAPADLIGREDETKLLNDAWLKVRVSASPRPRVLTFVALGGEGKTALVAKWVAELAGQDWPGCDGAFAWSFYSQGTCEQQAASSDLFLKEALTFFGDDADKAFATSPVGAFEKGQRLARLVGQRRSLLILDGLEPLQYAPTPPTPGQLKDQGVAALLKGLAAASHGLCVVTTRYSIPDLKAFWQTTAPEVKLLRLSRDAGVHLLKTLGVEGEAKGFDALVEEVKGHALTLQILGGFLRRAFGGAISQRNRVKFEKADAKIDGGHAFRTMAAYEQWLLRDGGDEGRREVAVLRLMGLFDRPADAGCLAALRSEPISGLTEPLAGLADDDWEFCLSGLEDAKLLTISRDASGALVSLDAHPLLRDYFGRQLRTQQPDAWRTAHQKLYEHLKDRKEGGGEPTLENLQPQIQSIVHACRANLYQEAFQAYYHAVDMGDRHHLTDALGAVGTDFEILSWFFAVDMAEPVKDLKPWSQAYLLRQLGMNYRTMVLFRPSTDRLRRSFDRFVALEDWRMAVNVARHLAQVYLLAGACDEAAAWARKAVETIGNGGVDLFNRVAARAGLAYVLFQIGRHKEARALFEEAEEEQKREKGPLSHLGQIAGYRYCDLLVEMGCYDAAKARVRPYEAKQVRKRFLVGHALTILAAARLELSTPPKNTAVGCATSTKLGSAVDSAVEELRRAGQLDYLVVGLLVRAKLRASQNTAGVQDDLDEAWEIAERGPMRLYMADIHLYRARLFFREKPYPWQSPEDDLAAAKKLINECGYHRRDEELADAKRAILGT